MPFTHGHALIVGVGTYQDPALSIPIAEMDARALAGILADPAVAGYPPNQVRLLTGPDASRKGILQAISDIAATVGRDSTVLLYFSGHAVSAPNGSYSFLPYDAHPGARGLVLGGRGSRRMVQFDRTTVSGSELLDAIRRIRASEVLVIFNTGLSALAGEGLAPTNPQERTQVSGLTLSPPPEDLMDAVLSTGEGRVVLSACRPNQKSWYFPYAFHTLFGLALLEGISDTRVIPDRNGYVSISDLYDYVYERVQEVTRNSGRDIDQEPVLTIMSSLRRFSVAQHMGGDLAAGFVGAENVKRPRERYAPDVRRITERQALEACQRIAGTGGGIIDVGRYNVEGIVGPIGHKADTLVQIIDGLDSMRYETEVSDVGIGADLSGEDTTRQLEGAADVTAETAKSIEEATPLPSTPPVAPGERLINTGFSSQSAPAQPFSAEMPLACNQPYYFWLEIGPLVKGAIEEEPTPLPVELLPAEAELTVALFAFDGELGLTWGADTGKLKLLPDGTVRVVSQPGQLPLPHHAVGLIRKRLFFPVQTARRAGTYRLRCNIYYEHVLVDSRLVSARVMRKPRATPGIHALRARRDYTLTRSLNPAELQKVAPHQLSIMVNNNGNGTHGFRFYGSNAENGQEFKSDATIDGDEIQQHIELIRKGLRVVAWGNDAEWTQASLYRYSGPPDMTRLQADLVRLAQRGYRVYDDMINELAGGVNEVESLKTLMKKPGYVQIALKESPRFVLPSALVYDYDLDPDLNAPDYSLCPGFIAALAAPGALDTSDCFMGNCPTSSGHLDVVCPSGFWGFRHNIGMPVSVAQGPDAPTEIAYQQPFEITAAVSQDPAFTALDGHLDRLVAMGAEVAVAKTRAETFDKFRNTAPDLVYFYCHGGFDAQKNVPFLLVGALTERPITRASLRSYSIKWTNPHPIVFINGCHTTSLEPDLAFDFVSAFIENAAAVGVIGTEISIFEPLATAFAEDWLRRILLGDTVGVAIRGTRLKLLKDGNPLGLVYIPYVLASLSVIKKQ